MRKKFHIVLLKISRAPIKNGKKVLLGMIRRMEGEMVSVQAHLRMKLSTIAE